MAKEKDKKPKRTRRKRSFQSRVFMTTTRVKMARFDFMTKARVKLARCDWSKLRDALEALLLLAWVVFLFGLFVISPTVVREKYGPGWGVLTALLGLPIWGTVGIRPMPGLLDGCICITGYIVILWTILMAILELGISFIR